MGIKSQEILDAIAGKGCLGKAAADEPVFILRAQDTFAPGVVEHWADQLANTRGGGHPKVAEARELAVAMRRWQEGNKEKVPD